MSNEISIKDIQQNVPLAPLNSWHIGGNAQYFYVPNSIEALQQAIQQLDKEVPITWLGLGSNVLIRDEGVSGLVIHSKKLNKIELVDGQIYAQAGVTCAKVAKFCAKNDFIGGEFFAGIPGTMGGALAMNAGAFGGETWAVVDKVYTLDRAGTVHIRTSDDFKIGYRSVLNLSEQNEAFLAATLKLKHQVGAGEIALENAKALLKKRNLSQPIGTFNCGSVFANPDGDHAARLIEACDLKGFKQGGAIISEKHANFIINSDHASSQDVESLIQLVRKTVIDRFGIELEPEVKIIGITRSVSRCQEK